MFHGTNVKPSEFYLEEDWNGDSGNVYVADVPEGYLYLTNDMREANAYGQYIIPCELKRYDTLQIKVDSNAPSQEFDDDFSGFGEYGMWSKFNDSVKSVLEVKGYNKSTYITDVTNVIPRTDLADMFYSNKKQNENINIDKFNNFMKMKEDIDTIIYDINLESELNITDSININDINHGAPNGAEYALLNPSGDFIQKFYKFVDVKYSDGTISRLLKYYGEQGSWHSSIYNDIDSKDYSRLKDMKFLKITY